MRAERTPSNQTAAVGGPDRFRKAAPVIALTPEVIADLRKLLDGAQQHASINGLPWRRGANAGKPLLYGGEEGRGALIANGTIGSWTEIDLAVAAVNALPALLAVHDALVGAMPILASAESNASGNPEWEYVGPRVAAVRAALQQAEAE
jgi:hypothetical protein